MARGLVTSICALALLAPLTYAAPVAQIRKAASFSVVNVDGSSSDTTSQDAASNAVVVQASSTSSTSTSAPTTPVLTATVSPTTFSTAIQSSTVVETTIINGCTKIRSWTCSGSAVQQTVTTIVYDSSTTSTVLVTVTPMPVPWASTTATTIRSVPMTNSMPVVGTMSSVAGTMVTPTAVASTPVQTPATVAIVAPQPSAALRYDDGQWHTSYPILPITTTPIAYYDLGYWHAPSPAAKLR